MARYVNGYGYIPHIYIVQSVVSWEYAESGHDVLVFIHTYRVPGDAASA